MSTATKPSACRHVIVYTELTDMMVLARAMQGRTTKAIARELGLSAAMVQYRIQKAQRALKTRFRSSYRGSDTPEVRQLLKSTEAAALRRVREEVTPIFKPLAGPGVLRVPAA